MTMNSQSILAGVGVASIIGLGGAIGVGIGRDKDTPIHQSVGLGAFALAAGSVLGGILIGQGNSKAAMVGTGIVAAMGAGLLIGGTLLSPQADAIRAASQLGH